MSFPKDTNLPFPLSKDSAHLISKVCELNVYINKGKLIYVLLLPLINRGTYDVYKLIPLPVPLTNSGKYVYVDTDKEILSIDKARQYYFMLAMTDLSQCKEMQPSVFICKQRRPLLSTHMHDNCAVKLMQPRSNIFDNCEKKNITDTVYTLVPTR